jgi:hypothetical protein
MILPRPIPLNMTIEQWVDLRDFINMKFKFLEEFKLTTQPNIIPFYRFDRIHQGKGGYVVMAKVANNKTRQVQLGLLKFYKEVTKDIGMMNGLFDNNKYNAVVWLMMGIDGELNVDRLAKALALNGELLPKDTEAGAALKALLAEANSQIVDDSKIVDTNMKSEIIDLIDTHLIRFNTYLDELARLSGVIINHDY